MKAVLLRTVHTSSLHLRFSANENGFSQGSPALRWLASRRMKGNGIDWLIGGQRNDTGKCGRKEGRMDGRADELTDGRDN